jgi:hypothetical protein
MDDENIQKHYIQDNQLVNTQQINNHVLKANKQKNEERIVFFKFLIYNTKIEVHITQLQGYLYWISILEFALWIVLLACFISSPSSMGINWLFIYHIARGGVGIFILIKIPSTHEVIENLTEFESTSLEDLQKDLQLRYAELLNQYERALRPLLIVYFILTIISLIIDFILFVVLATQLYDLSIQYRNYVVLITLVVFISIYFYLL